MSMEILVRVNSSVDILGGMYGNGHSVVAKPSGWQWGGLECPPDFIRVVVNDANTEDDIQKVMDPWERQLTYDIISADPSDDFFKVRIYSDPVISSNNPVAQITAKEMTSFLQSWGASGILPASSETGVLFQIDAFDAIKSEGLFTFGPDEDPMMKYTQLSYDPTTGIHTVQIDYSLSALKKDEVVGVIVRAPKVTLVFIDDTKGLCVISTSRTDMIGVLEDQVYQKFTKMLARVRWRFKDSIVSIALANGGIVNMNLADIDGNLIDVSTEV